MKTALVNFHWVASVWNDPDQSAFHVTVRDTAETMEEAAKIGGLFADRVLNVKQASGEGFDLKSICSAINTEAMAEAEVLKAENAKLRADRDVSDVRV